MKSSHPYVIFHGFPGGPAVAVPIAGAQHIIYAVSAGLILPLSSHQALQIVVVVVLH